MINKCIKQLVQYGKKHHLIEEEDEIYITNRMLALFKLKCFKDPGDVSSIENAEDLECVLKKMTEYGIEKGIILENSSLYRDLFDTAIMDILMPKPSQVIDEFWSCYKASPKEATDYYYSLSIASNYIRKNRVKQDKKWKVNTEYGELDITINLSKPEKDSREIALAKMLPASDYPKCLLCVENEGYAGHENHPARQNHRVIPITIQGEKWGMQYSPYVYYREHCIVFCWEHVPMKINRDTFCKLFDFVRQFPHYFLGSNAELPVVGGSILSHEHFQGGNYEFPMAKAPIEQRLLFTGYEDITAGIVKWPMSVIRLCGDSIPHLVDLCEKILVVWKNYTDSEAYIYAYTDGVEHNTITPIARKRNGKYEMDLVLRNNITTNEHPHGLYHPWEQYHHIKKENIGLIEVMGLAVLPARLKGELEEIKRGLRTGEICYENEKIAMHADWIRQIREKYGKIEEDRIEAVLQKEIGIVFQKILECAGVFKRNENGRQAFARFIKQINR